MAFMLLFICFLQPEATRIQLLKTGKSLIIETNKYTLQYPKKILHFPERNHLYFLDGPSLAFLSFNYSTSKFNFSSGKGQGPDELNDRMVSFYQLNDQLVVIHSNGMKTSRFSIEGKPLGTTSNKSFSFYTSEDISVVKSKSIIALEKNGKTIDSYEDFKFDDYGFESDSLLHGNYLVISSSTSKNNTIKYVVFDLKNQRLHDIGLIEKVLKFSENDIPELKKMGAPQGSFFSSNYTMCISHDQFGVMFMEYCPESAKTNFTKKSIIRCLNPELKSTKTLIVSHPEYSSLAMLFPLSDGKTWIGFDGIEDQLVWFRSK